MPEAIVPVPLLHIPSESSSSSTAEITDRSNDSRHDNRQVDISEKKLCVKTQGKNKMRKSYGKRYQKKTQLRSLTSDKRLTSASKFPKSHIPRAVALAASSSTTSLSTSDSLPSPLIPAVKKLTEERSVSPKNNSSCLVRQKSALILAFRQRKSFSQMDFSQARRQINFPVPSLPSHRTIDDSEDNRALVPSQCGDNMMVSHSKSSFVPKIYNQGYYFAMPGRDSQMAGMKIFATIMLNAWRKRRDEVRRLIDEVADLKRTATKAKNQLHVFNSLFRVEKKRNDELNFQLKKSLENVNLTKTSCENLTTSLISLKAEKALLEQNLQTKEHEIDGIKTLLTQTKSDLFKSMTLQRELQASLSMEQRKVQTLQNQKNELINEICELNNEAMQKEQGLRKEIQEKCIDLQNLHEEMEALNRSTEQMLTDSKTREQRTRQEIEAMESELKIMHKCLEATVGNRLKRFWNNSMTYQKLILQMLHWLAYYALPATPPPIIKTLPFGFSLERALSIVKS